MVTDASAVGRDAVIDVVVRRGDVLAAILDEPRERHELVDDVDAAKSTVYKAISQLEAANLVERGPDGLCATTFGRVVYDRYRALSQVAELDDLLSTVPPDAPLDPSVFDGAETITPVPHAVDRHLTQAAAMLEVADAIRGVVTVAAPVYVEAILGRAREDVPIELVLGSSLAEHLRGRYPDVVSELDGYDHVSVWEFEDAFTFSFAITTSDGDERVILEFTDETGVVGLAVNDSAASVAWADSLLATVQDEAEPVRR